MAWQEVEVDLGGSRKGRCLWSIKVKHGGARLTVPMDLANKLGWAATTTLSLQVGTGNDAGMLRLIEHPNGSIRAMKPYANAKSLQYRLGFWQGLPRQDQEQVAIRHEVLDGALVLHPPAPAEKAAVRLPRPTASIMSEPPPQRPVGGKIDVTSKFFDDPKRPVQMASGVRGGRS